MIISFYSPDGRYDDVYLSNYATIHVLDELLRIDGVSEINYQGEGNYSIRVWLDPQKLASLNMTVLDVANAIRNQNLDAPAGMLGQQPSTRTQPFELPIDTLGRLTTTEQFGDIIVKADQGQPPPPPSAPLTPSTGPHGLPTLGTTGPLDTGAHSSASGGTMATGDTTPGTGKTFESGTTTGLTSSATTGMTGMGTSSGGGTTTGGAQSIGGATTGGGATATVMGGGSTSLGSGASIPGTTPGVAGSGVLSATTMGRGPGRPAAGIVRLRDVGRVELGAQNYSLGSTFDGHPSVGLAIFQLPGTNALDVADRIRAKMEELKADFPEGVDYAIAYDTTPFIRESVADVVQTLLEAVMLVAMVVLVFLQNWRAALIPLVAVPVAIIGTFAVMAALGFSLNNISLFGLVLAIGIVVDDAIVVVENVERWLEQGLPPREAARRAMDEVTGPVIAVALVLCAVFVPCAFISGITGQFFRQFAVTIAVSTVISAFNSLTLSPALAAILLKPHGVRRDPLTWLLDLLLGWFFRLFNWAFGKGTAGYGWVVGRLLRGSVLVVLVYGGLLVLTGLGLPRGARRASSRSRTRAGSSATSSCPTRPRSSGLRRRWPRSRRSPAGRRAWPTRSRSRARRSCCRPTAPISRSMFVVLEPFAKRRSPDLTDTAIMARLRAAWAREIKDAQVIAFGAPPIPGLSVAGGFKLMVEDRGGLGPAALQRQTDELVRKLRANPALTGVSTQFRSNTPQTLHRHRPDQGRLAGRVAAGRQPDAGDLPRLALRQQLQRVRPPLAGDRPGRGQVPQPGRGHQPAPGAQPVGGRWSRWAPWSTCARSAARSIVTRYNLSSAAPSPATCAPGVSSGDAIARRSTACPARHCRCP